MKFFATIVSFAALTIAAPTALPAENLEVRNDNAITDRLLFTDSLAVFLRARQSKNPAHLDWSSDGCSYVPNAPAGFNFLNACYRHDFGYRNYKKQRRFSRANRKRIDVLFRTDMRGLCENYRAKRTCRAAANLYYTGVRMFGGIGRSLDTRDIDGADAEEYQEYLKALEEYKVAVEEDKKAGLLPADF
ncbi:hypothetical protein LOZ58_004636 [Ophidiomyces ophidiicola]|nr:hypothetical protein LOZ58_004636 [Ophidiomyces ophidiicola]